VTSGQFRGIAALMLAVGLSATVILLAVETILHTGPISTQEASLLSTTLGAIIGALAVYLGGHTAPEQTPAELPPPGPPADQMGEP
jgi:membrane protein DedA with SNARE-associated domain